MDRAASQAAAAGSDRLGHKVKFKASCAVGLLSTQLDQARKVKAAQNSTRRVLAEGKERRERGVAGRSKRRDDEVQNLLIILKSAVIKAEEQKERVPTEVSTTYMRSNRL